MFDPGPSLVYINGHPQAQLPGTVPIARSPSDFSRLEVVCPDKRLGRGDQKSPIRALSRSEGATVAGSNTAGQDDIQTSVILRSGSALSNTRMLPFDRTAWVGYEKNN
jgi:hypothetical protein